MAFMCNISDMIVISCSGRRNHFLIIHYILVFSQIKIFANKKSQ